MADTTEVGGPAITRRQKMNLDGSGFTVATSDVLIDGRETGIVYAEETSGSRGGYKYTRRALVQGEDELDLLNAHPGPEAVRDWILSRAPRL